MTYPYQRYQFLRPDGSTIAFDSIPAKVNAVEYLRCLIRKYRATKAIPVGPTQPLKETA